MRPGAAIHQQRDRDDDPDEQPRQGVEEEDAEQGRHRRDEVRSAPRARRSVPAGRSRRDRTRSASDSPPARSAPRSPPPPGSPPGSCSNKPVRNSRVTIVSAATTSPETCVRAPAPAFTAVFDRLPLTTMPPDSPDARLAVPSPISSRFGVDVVVVPRRVVLGGAEALREPDQRDPDRRGGDAQVVVQRRPSAARTSAGRPGSARRCPRPSRRARTIVTTPIPKPTAISDPGTTGRYSLSPTTMISETTPTARVGQVRPAEVREEAEELLEEVALGLLDPEQLRELADDDRQRQPDDEALQHRLRDEAREEAESEQPRDERDDPDHQREGDRRRQELVRAARGHSRRPPRPTALPSRPSAPSRGASSCRTPRTGAERPGAAYRPTTGETPAIVA